MASKELENVIQMLKSMPVAEKASIQQTRVEMEKMTFLQSVPEGAVLRPVEIGSLPAEWVVPDNARENAVILYLHGGGYCIGSIRTHRPLAARIACASKARALLIDYRLAPENPFPAAVADAVTAYRWLIKEKIPPEKMIIAGDSAGGGLAISTLIDLRNNKDPLPAAAVCISPWTDLAMTGQSITTKASVDPMVQREGLSEMAKAYLGGADPLSPLASPLYGNFRGLPPLLIHVGTAEVLLDDSARLAEKAAAAGVSVTYEAWQDMIHVWHAFADVLPEAVEAIDKIGKFISSTYLIERSESSLKGESVNKLSVCLMVLLFAAGGFLLSCSDNKTEKSEKGAIEKMSDETAKKISDKMLAPVENAKAVKHMEENRLHDLQDTAQKEAAGK